MIRPMLAAAAVLGAAAVAPAPAGPRSEPAGPPVTPPGMGPIQAPIAAADELRPAVGPHWPGRSTPLPPAEIQSLTDQVVRVMDQRLLAHRERFGRI